MKNKLMQNFYAILKVTSIIIGKEIFMVKKILKSILIIILVIVVLFGAYFAYVLLSYHRIEDNLQLDIEGESATDALKTNEMYRISSANLGFGAYSDDYSFFMDGGTESWAFSKHAVNKNIKGI